MPVNPSRSLTDQHGEWCSGCLDYFENGENRQRHHPLNQKWIRDRFGEEINFRWVIPAHDMTRCHKSLQNRANHATDRFFQTLDEAKTLGERERLSRRLHDYGYYWLSVLTNLDTIRKRVEGIEREQQSQRCAFALSSLAGVRGGRNLDRIIMRDSTPILTPQIRLNLTNLQAARGYGRSAEQSFMIVKEIIDGLPERDKRKLTPALLRRTTQLSRSTRDACEAVIAAETDYNRDTALVMLGILAVSSRQFSDAERSLEELRKRRDGTSWLYKAEEQFIRALYLIVKGSKDDQQIYSSLCMAQYIFVVLGLQMSISPELSFVSPHGRLRDWTPSDVLRAYFVRGTTHWISDRECFEIRRRTIGESNLLGQLVDPMNFARPHETLLTNPA